MLISKVPDEGGREGGHEVPIEEDHTHEYQTANELFEIMAKNQNFQTSDMDTLTTRDLVLLYKNIDLGTKLMSNANEIKLRKPNQHVETIVYNEEPESEGSDISEIYSNEDLRNVFLINKERIDLFSTPPSMENTLCHKLGDLDIQTSDLTTDYDKHFLFKDPYIKEQLKSLNIATETETTVLPASLLDYICCKRLEDNYNFYMDNIIRYVKHTIEQLKRISNGDYLTDKAKEKWREVKTAPTEDPRNNNTKVLASSTSIPLHVERKVGGRQSTWDDLVHSAVDIRSLSKILEKKIVVEVPKLICGSYKLLSKRCADNLIISCKKDKQPNEDKEGESRVDVVFQLQRSETGQVLSNINSIMILQTAPAIQCETRIAGIPAPLPLTYKEVTEENTCSEQNVKIIELEQTDVTEELKETLLDSERSEISDIERNSDIEGSGSLINSSYQESTESSDQLRDILVTKYPNRQREVACDVVYPDELRLTIQKLTMQSALPEESGEDISQSTAVKKKSPTRIRIKSPYENPSLLVEEKKRRKLLEIRERRERKKMALAENCKITKHKYGKGAIMPQPASSVTKLSITNKSFYNSIYGHSMDVNNKQTKGRNRKGKREVVDTALGSLDGEQEESILTPEINSKKYINRSYYLDDAVTEMMYMNMKQKENDGICSASTSVISNDFRNNLNLLSQLIGPSDTEFNVAERKTSGADQAHMLSAKGDCITSNGDSKILPSSQTKLSIAPSNSLHVEEMNNDDSKNIISSVECRKSIDQIYNLMKEIEKAQDKESKSCKSKIASNSSENKDVKGRESSTFQGSDSGTSLKHRLTSSNPSIFSFGKNNNDVLKSHSFSQNPESPTAVVPKVIISTKTLPIKADLLRNKKDRKKSVTNPIIRISENPLKAISQLLHEFENVQKQRQKPVTEQKSPKKSDLLFTDSKSGSRQSSLKRRSRLDHQLEAERFFKVTTPKEKKAKPFSTIGKNPYQQIAVDDKHTDKNPKKKVVDILDEAKEARGEAVRGPSKLNSRLNSLAQPKRSYVQAHSEELQSKYGKSLMADRLQKLAAAPTPGMLDRSTASAYSKNRLKRSGTEAVSAVSVKLSSPPVPLLERARTRHSPSSSPETRDRLSQRVGPSYKQITVPETPETLKKKMVAVESYVKNHYGRTTSTAVVIEAQNVQTARVPVVPNDIELASSSSSPTAKGSTELGSRLHDIISSIIKTTSQGLEVLPESPESISKLSDNLSRSEQLSSDTDYTLDVLDDNNIQTSVENIEKLTSKLEQKDTIAIEVDTTQYKFHEFKSVTELEKLEHALYRRISVGTFPKRLQINNLTLTPKQSIQQVFVLQSGDVGSLIVKTPLAQSLNDIKSDNLLDLATFPVISKTHFDWTFTNFPMQISTVGYAFPEYKSIQCGSTHKKILDELFEDKDENSSLYPNPSSDKNSQYLKDNQSLPLVESTDQVNVQTPTFVSIGISSMHLIDSETKDEIKQTFTTYTETNHGLLDISKKKIIPNLVHDTALEKTAVKSDRGRPDDIEYTTSLDILVGLLNEIQNITTCQTQITNSDENEFESQENMELETILNKAATLKKSFKSTPSDAVSLTSLEKFRKLESNPSVYSFYLSDIEGSERVTSKIIIPSVIIPLNTNSLLNPKEDKEVSVDIVEKEYVNTLTDVPSQLFPININHSTNMSNSLVGMLSEPSVQSMFSVAEYHSVCSNASLSHNQIIEIPQMTITCESITNTFDEIHKAVEKPTENKSHKKKIQSFGNNRIKKIEKFTKTSYCLKSDFDPLMKVKRDILVMFYSILVFTVFAALTYPSEILYHV